MLKGGGGGGILPPAQQRNEPLRSPLRLNDSTGMYFQKTIDWSK